MSREIIATGGAPSSPVFSQGVKAGPFVFVSRMVGIDTATGKLAGSEIAEQLRQALANCRAILEAGGASLDDVVEVGILLVDPDDFAALNAEYTRWFPASPPARYVAKLGVNVPGVLVSARMTAYVAR